MKHKLTINSQQVKDRACLIIQSLPLDEPCEVIIRPNKVKLSDAQRRLYFKWVGIICADLGETKKECHHRLKKEHLLHIFERDDPEYEDLISTLRELYKSGKTAEAEFLHKQVIRLTSITKASTKQMTEFMTAVERECIGLDIRLPHPEDMGE